MIDLLTLSCASGSGLIAGFLYSFSTCVMAALSKQPPAQAIRTMQTINVVVLNPWFLVPFLGSAVLCLVTGVRAVRNWGSPEAAFCLAGSLLYVLGTVGVTILFNVPRNNRLAGISPDSEAGPSVWASYLRTWTAWNHVRTFTAFAASLMFAFALGT